MKDYKLLFGEENFDESFSLVVYYQDPNSFGPHPIKIIGIIDEKETVVIKDKIYNDGKNLNEGLVLIKWITDGAEVTLFGDEQDPIAYLVKKVNDKLVTTKIKE